MSALNHCHNNNESSTDPPKHAIATVLVIEDNEIELELLHETLQANGFSSTKANNVQEGLTHIMRNTFDIAIIDIFLPDGNGFKLLKLFTEKYEHVINIIITGNASIENAEKAMTLGADGYVIKPYDFESLEQLMVSCLNSKRLEKVHEINKLSPHSQMKSKNNEPSLLSKFYKQL